MPVSQFFTTKVVACHIPAHAAHKSTGDFGSGQSLQPFPGAFHCICALTALLHVCTSHAPCKLLSNAPVPCPLQDLCTVMVAWMEGEAEMSAVLHTNTRQECATVHAALVCCTIKDSMQRQTAQRCNQVLFCNWCKQRCTPL